MRPFYLGIIVILAACNHQEPSSPAGNTARGKQLVAQYGCTSCHIIPGVDGPRGEVGPSLEHVATRQLLAGKLPNNPQNMSLYLQNPQMANPQNAMPNLGLNPDQVRDIAAYLYTLK